MYFLCLQCREIFEITRQTADDLVSWIVAHRFHTILYDNDEIYFTRRESELNARG